MTQAAGWGRLPAELRQLNQWVLAGPDKTPLSVNGQGELYNASSTDPAQWLSYAAAAHYAAERGLGIGFVLSANDPYTCIDFDVKDASNEPDASKHTHPDAYWYFWELAQKWDSYCELSRNGKGMHLWVRANIGKGVRRFPFEMYSQERYIICTGNVVLDRPIAERQEWAEGLAAQMGGATERRVTQLVEVPPVMEDDAVMQMAWNAENGFNFQELWKGNWKQFGHPSQSEADLALMSMLTFYSKSNSQCRRLFRMSALGKREKSVKNDRYLDFTLTTIRARQASEVKVDVSAMEKSAEMRMREKRAAEMPTMHVPAHAVAVATAPSASVAVATAAPLTPAAAAVGDEGLPWPPGFTRALAGFIHDSAPRQVKEVAIIGALGLLAGICGKAWYIPNSGLNVYLILVARSAIGKEAMHTGVSALIKAASVRAPAIMQFVDFTDFASGPALMKACAANTSFVNVTGEWGRKLKRLAQDDGRDTGMATLRTMMTNLYQKSGPQAIVGGITYSNKDSNIASVSGVAYSMIGETTPKTFYESLTETMMEDGFLSRFTIIEYNGKRPELNPDPLREPPKPIADALGELAQQAHNLIGTQRPQPVGADREAAELVWSFEKECDEQINSAPEDESHRQMWNRASLKVMRISALLAVADNSLHPVVNKEHVEWALQLIRRDIEIMRRRMDSGDVGTDDAARERKMIVMLRDYVRNGATDGYDIPKALQDNCIIPHKLLQIKCANINTFKAHKLGSTEAVKQVMRSMVDSGYVMECNKDKMVEGYNFHGKAYRILELPDQKKGLR